MIPSAIDLDRLRTFVAVCRHGSLTRAAAASGRSQPTLSMQMRRLEGLLNVALFRRTGRGVVVTPEGEVFLSYATRMLTLGDKAMTRMHGPSGPEGVVRIALPEEVVLQALPAALGRFRQSHPRIRLEVMVDDTAAAGLLWRDGKLDVLAGVPSTMTPEDGVPHLTWNVGLSWVCGVSYVQASGQPIDLVVFPEPCIWRRRMVETLDVAGCAWRIAFTSRSVAAVQAAVENGLGVTVLPRDCIRPSSMRPFSEGPGLSEPLIVQYGLYARTAREPFVEPLIQIILGGVDKFEPVSGGGEVDHAEEAAGQLVVAGGDGAIDLEVAEHALDAVALLVEFSVVLDLYSAV